MGNGSVVVKSVDDLAPAIEWAGENPKARWYVARMAQALKRPDLIPDDWDITEVSSFREQTLTSADDLQRSAEVDQALDAFADTVDQVHSGTTSVADAAAMVASIARIADHNAYADELAAAIRDGADVYVSEGYITAEELAPLVAAAKKPDGSKVRKVRTAAGVKRYKAPIGTPIVKKNGKWVADRSAIRTDGKADEAPASDGPRIASDAKPVLTNAAELEDGDEILDRNGNPQVITGITSNGDGFTLTVEDEEGVSRRYTLPANARVNVVADTDETPDVEAPAADAPQAPAKSTRAERLARAKQLEADRKAGKISPEDYATEKQKIADEGVAEQRARDRKKAEKAAQNAGDAGIRDVKLTRTRADGVEVGVESGLNSAEVRARNEETRAQLADPANTFEVGEEVTDADGNRYKITNVYGGNPKVTAQPLDEDGTPQERLTELDRRTLSRAESADAPETTDGAAAPAETPEQSAYDQLVDRVRTSDEQTAIDEAESVSPELGERMRGEIEEHRAAREAFEQYSPEVDSVGKARALRDLQNARLARLATQEEVNSALEKSGKLRPTEARKRRSAIKASRDMAQSNLRNTTRDLEYAEYRENQANSLDWQGDSDRSEFKSDHVTATVEYDETNGTYRWKVSPTDQTDVGSRDREGAVNTPTEARIMANANMLSLGVHPEDIERRESDRKAAEARGQARAEKESAKREADELLAEAKALAQQYAQHADKESPEALELGVRGAELMIRRADAQDRLNDARHELEEIDNGAHTSRREAIQAERANAETVRDTTQARIDELRAAAAPEVATSTSIDLTYSDDDPAPRYYADDKINEAFAAGKISKRRADKMQADADQLRDNRSLVAADDVVAYQGKTYRVVGEKPDSRSQVYVREILPDGGEGEVRPVAAQHLEKIDAPAPEAPQDPKGMSREQLDTAIADVDAAYAEWEPRIREQMTSSKGRRQRFPQEYLDLDKRRQALHSEQARRNAEPSTHGTGRNPLLEGPSDAERAQDAKDRQVGHEAALNRDQEVADARARADANRARLRAEAAARRGKTTAPSSAEPAPQRDDDGHEYAEPEPAAPKDGTPASEPAARRTDTAEKQETPASAGNRDLADVEAQAKRDGSTVLFHGGLPEGATLDDIDLNRNGTQQNKRGRSFGGFYLTDESSREWSDKYASERGGVMHGFAISPDARILDLSDKGRGKTDRVSAEQRAAWAEDYDVVVGPDLMGRTQYLLLNKNAVVAVGETNVNNPGGNKTPDAPKADTPEAAKAPEAPKPDAPTPAAGPADADRDTSTATLGKLSRARLTGTLQGYSDSELEQARINADTEFRDLANVPARDKEGRKRRDSAEKIRSTARRVQEQRAAETGGPVIDRVLADLPPSGPYGSDAFFARNREVQKRVSALSPEDQFLALHAGQARARTTTDDDERHALQALHSTAYLAVSERAQAAEQAIRAQRGEQDKKAKDDAARAEKEAREARRADAARNALPDTPPDTWTDEQLEEVLKLRGAVRGDRLTEVNYSNEQLQALVDALQERRTRFQSQRLSHTSERNRIDQAIRALNAHHAERAKIAQNRDIIENPVDSEGNALKIRGVDGFGMRTAPEGERYRDENDQMRVSDGTVQVYDRIDAAAIYRLGSTGYQQWAVIEQNPDGTVKIVGSQDNRDFRVRDWTQLPTRTVDPRELTVGDARGRQKNESETERRFRRGEPPLDASRAEVRTGERYRITTGDREGEVVQVLGTLADASDLESVPVRLYDGTETFLPASELRHVDVRAPRPRQTPEPEGAPAAPTEDRIRAAYTKLASRPGAWVSLTDLRAELSDLPKSDVDTALAKLYRQDDVSLVPEENQKALTDEDRASAVTIGFQPHHAIAIEGAPAPEVTPEQQAHDQAQADLTRARENADKAQQRLDSEITRQFPQIEHDRAVANVPLNRRGMTDGDITRGVEATRRNERAQQELRVAETRARNAAPQTDHNPDRDRDPNVFRSSDGYAAALERWEGSRPIEWEMEYDSARKDAKAAGGRNTAAAKRARMKLALLTAVGEDTGMLKNGRVDRRAGSSAATLKDVQTKKGITPTHPDTADTPEAPEAATTSLADAEAEVARTKQAAQDAQRAARRVDDPDARDDANNAFDRANIAYMQAQIVRNALTTDNPATDAQGMTRNDQLNAHIVRLERRIADRDERRGARTERTAKQEVETANQDNARAPKKETPAPEAPLAQAPGQDASMQPERIAELQAQMAARRARRQQANAEPAPSDQTNAEDAAIRAMREYLTGGRFADTFTDADGTVFDRRTGADIQPGDRIRMEGMRTSFRGRTTVDYATIDTIDAPDAQNMRSYRDTDGNFGAIRDDAGVLIAQRQEPAASEAVAPAADASTDTKVYKVGGGYQNWVIESTNADGTVNLVPAPGAQPVRGRARNRHNVDPAKLREVTDTQTVEAPAPSGTAHSDSAPATSGKLATLRDKSGTALDAGNTYTLGRGYQEWRVVGVNADGTVNLEPAAAKPGTRKRWNVAPAKLAPAGTVTADTAPAPAPAPAPKKPRRTDTPAQQNKRVEQQAAATTPEEVEKAAAPRADVTTAPAAPEPVVTSQETTAPSPAKKGMTPRVYAVLINAHNQRAAELEEKITRGDATDQDRIELESNRKHVEKLRGEMEAGNAVNTAREVRILASTTPVEPAAIPTRDDDEEIAPDLVADMPSAADSWADAEADQFELDDVIPASTSEWGDLDDDTIGALIDGHISEGEFDAPDLSGLLDERLYRDGVRYQDVIDSNPYGAKDADTLRANAEAAAARGDWLEVARNVEGLINPSAERPAQRPVSELTTLDEVSDELARAFEAEDMEWVDRLEARELEIQADLDRAERAAAEVDDVDVDPQMEGLLRDANHATIGAHVRRATAIVNQWNNDVKSGAVANGNARYTHEEAVTSAHIIRAINKVRGERREVPEVADPNSVTTEVLEQRAAEAAKQAQDRADRVAAIEAAEAARRSEQRPWESKTEEDLERFMIEAIREGRFGEELNEHILERIRRSQGDATARNAENSIASDGFDDKYVGLFPPSRNQSITRHAREGRWDEVYRYTRGAEIAETEPGRAAIAEDNRRRERDEWRRGRPQVRDTQNGDNYAGLDTLALDDALAHAVRGEDGTTDTFRSLLDQKLRREGIRRDFRPERVYASRQFDELVDERSEAVESGDWARASRLDDAISIRREEHGHDVALFDRLVALGWDEGDAETAAYYRREGAEETLQRRRAIQRIRDEFGVGGTGNNFRQMLDRGFSAAAMASAGDGRTFADAVGYSINPDGQRKGVTEADIIRGSDDFIRRYATDELKNHFSTHGRVTRDSFRRYIMGETQSPIVPFTW